ncbi:MAG: hypothetical protein R3B40_29015 [Polyangiales bacterium]|nr:hypothetical protein [Sandaracinaceae bacterium]
MTHAPLPSRRQLATLCALPCVLLLLSHALAGCGDAAAQTTVQVDAADLACADFDPTLEAWESAGWAGDTCAWITFSPRTTFEIAHPLGRVPKAVLVYIAFSESGASATLASGDAGLILGATTETVTVRNNTDQRFFLRVVAH